MGGYPIEGRLKSGEKVFIVDFLTLALYARGMREVIHNTDLNYVKFNFKGHNLTFFGIEGNGDLTAAFSDYDFLDVKDKVVLDVGANIGDSAVYFAVNGARKVIAIEPVKETYNILVRNIMANNFQDLIIPLPYNLSKISGEVYMNRSDILGTGTVLHEDPKSGYKILNVKLGDILNSFDLTDGVLKMDCEGCEYALLNEDDKTLKNIDMLQIEYHYGYQRLVNKLKETGFDVKYTKPVKSYNSEAENPRMEVGYIYAKRIQ